jgi:hypothetical protein
MFSAAIVEFQIAVDELQVFTIKEISVIENKIDDCNDE